MTSPRFPLVVGGSSRERNGSPNNQRCPARLGRRRHTPLEVRVYACTARCTRSCSAETPCMALGRFFYGHHAALHTAASPGSVRRHGGVPNDRSCTASEGASRLGRRPALAPRQCPAHECGRRGSTTATRRTTSCSSAAMKPQSISLRQREGRHAAPPDPSPRRRAVPWRRPKSVRHRSQAMGNRDSDWRARDRL
jgi:hypothetical protein